VTLLVNSKTLWMATLHPTVEGQRDRGCRVQQCSLCSWKFSGLDLTNRVNFDAVCPGGRMTEIPSHPDGHIVVIHENVALTAADIHTMVTLAPRPPDRHRATVYLARLAPGSQRTTRTALETIASLLTGGQATAASLARGRSAINIRLPCGRPWPSATRRRPPTSCWPPCAGCCTRRGGWGIWRPRPIRTYSTEAAIRRHCAVEAPKEINSGSFRRISLAVSSIGHT